MTSCAASCSTPSTLHVSCKDQGNKQLFWIILGHLRRDHFKPICRPGRSLAGPTQDPLQFGHPAHPILHPGEAKDVHESTSKRIVVPRLSHSPRRQKKAWVRAIDKWKLPVLINLCGSSGPNNGCEPSESPASPHRINFHIQIYPHCNLSVTSRARQRTNAFSDPSLDLTL